MGKSELKNIVFRSPQFASARHLTAPGSLRDGFPVAFDDPAVRVVFEDAPIRFAGGSFAKPGTVGAQAVAAFLRPIDQVFLHCPHVHTFVLCNDKRTLVPKFKSATQQQRIEALSKSDATWTWDGRSPVISMDALIPPWSAVRSNRSALIRAEADLVGLILSHVRIPSGRRLIIEHGDVPWVVTEAGHEPAPALVNTAGEADVCAQLYTQWACDGFPGDDLTVYPPGGIVLRSPDTDYLQLAFTQPPRAHGVWICSGLVSVDAAGTIGKRTETTEFVHEYFEVNALNRAVAHLYGDAPAASWSTLAFVCTCGNDYVTKPNGVSRRDLWAAFQHCAYEQVQLVADGPRLLPNGFIVLITWAYAWKYKLMPTDPCRPWRSVSYREIESVAQKKKLSAKNWPVSEDVLWTWYQTVQWCLIYADTRTCPGYVV